MDDLISRQAALSLAKDICVPTADGITYKHRCVDPDEIRHLPSAQISLIEAVKIIEDFLHGCHDSLTSEIVTPDGIKLHTDWGYFEEGLEEIKRWCGTEMRRGEEDG